MARLAMIYDADGGLVGEVRYVVGHLLGRAECALCDITHGPVSRKRDFDALVAELEAQGHRVEVHHRNEQRDGQAAASAGKLPCVLVSDAPSDDAGDVAWEVLMDWGARVAGGGPAPTFGPALRAALDARS
jgi:hypothetical protein